MSDPNSLSILVLVAGTNESSNSNRLADAFIDGLREQGIMMVEKIRLKDLHLDHFTLAHYEQTTDQGADFHRIREAVEKAHGVVIATPIWNFGVPAHLKNLIDRMGSFALDAETRAHGTLEGKPFYFIFTGGAPVAAWKGLMRFTLSHLTEGIRYFNGTITGRFFEGKCMVSKGKFGLVVDQRPETLERAKRSGKKFAMFVERFVRTGRLPLFYRLFAKAYKLGQRILAKFF
jgi:multimeric flavodoxin WrbA